MGPSWWISW